MSPDPRTPPTGVLNALAGADPHHGARNSSALEALHAEAMTAPCPRPPHGCGQAAGERCVNLVRRREPGTAPDAAKVPHPQRLLAARPEVPGPRGELDTPPRPRRRSRGTEAIEEAIARGAQAREQHERRQGMHLAPQHEVAADDVPLPPEPEPEEDREGEFA